MSTPLHPAQSIADHARPSDDTIEAIIHHATSSRQDNRPMRDTRTQLFVGNLPYRVRWQDLKDLFRKAGTVLRADVSLGPDNRSRGYGTVLLATAEDAGRAVDMFNGYTWQTRVLEVRLDRLMPEYELGRVGLGSGIALSMGGTAGGSGPGADLSALHSIATSIAGAGGPYLGVGGSLGGATSPAHSGLATAFTPSTTSTDPILPSHFSLLAGPNLASPLLKAAPFSHNYSSRPSSSSAALANPPDFLHSSASSSAAAEFQSTDPNANRTLYVGNLPFHIQWQDLKDLFRQAGTILRADVALGPDNRSRGFGTVIFATEADAERAVKFFNGYEYNGRILKVHHDKFSSLTTSIPLASTFLPDASSYVTLNTPASPTQQQYGLHLNSSQNHSSSRSQQSSTCSTTAHSAASSPLPGHAPAIHSLHGQPHYEGRKGYSTVGLNPNFESSSHPQAPAFPIQQHPGHTTLPPGFLYDYRPPASPDEFYKRQQQEKGYIERIQQQQTERDRTRQEGQTKGRSEEKAGLLQQQREFEWNLERDFELEAHIRRPLAQALTAASSILDMENLETTLVMKHPDGSGRFEPSPAPISAPTSVSASDYSASNSNSNPSSVPHSTASSKPPSTKPLLGAFTVPHTLSSVSSSSLPAHFGLDGLSLQPASGTMSAGGSRKTSFTSSLGTDYDIQYQNPLLYPPSMTTCTSTGSATTSTTESSMISDTGSAAVSSAEEELISSRSPLMRQDLVQLRGCEEKNRGSSQTVSETGSGRLSRSSKAESRGGSRSGSRIGIKDDGYLPHTDQPASESSRSTSSQGHSQATAATQEGQTQKHPHHPGPIALPPPPSMSFNPVQMPLIMPLATMTPGHPHGHIPTPHAFPMMGINMSPLYHPAHHAMSAMAAAAIHGGGSPSPFAMYPGPPAMAGAMVPLTPHGLPPMTPSMPPFTFFPQQYYGNVGVKGSGDEGHNRERGVAGRDGDGRPDGRDGTHQMSRSQTLRLNLNAVPRGSSPAITMSPGTFYGRPGQVPHPNPYINAAVGAPVHSVMAHPAQSPLQHPAYQAAYVAGVPHGLYPYPISPKQGEGEPKGYFDHLYIPGVSAAEGDEGSKGGSGVVDQAVSEGTGFSEDLGSKEAEAVSPAHEVSSHLLGDGDAGVEENAYAPSRTHSVGYNRPSSSHGRKFHRSGSDPASGSGVRETEKDVKVENDSTSETLLH